MKMLAAGSPQLKKAVGVLKELSADERTRLIAEAQEKARRDEASRVNWARHEGKEEGKHKQAIKIALNLIKLNMPIDEIV
jgi:ribulose 1,5-bisphosphate carboxylase large subunit-like protein